VTAVMLAGLAVLLLGARAALAILLRVLVALRQRELDAEIGGLLRIAGLAATRGTAGTGARAGAPGVVGLLGRGLRRRGLLRLSLLGLRLLGLRLLSLCLLSRRLLSGRVLRRSGLLRSGLLRGRRSGGGGGRGGSGRSGSAAPADRVDELALAQTTSALDAETGGDGLQLGELLGREVCAGGGVVHPGSFLSDRSCRS